MSENEDIKKAKEELERIKLNEQDQRLAELRMKYILDQNAIRNYLERVKKLEKIQIRTVPTKFMK